MSLEVAAKYLAAHGRGPDDQLVHMSRKEVAGLESIAKAMGGSLTTNPHTGLTEAGFLDDVAPLVIGAGLAAATGGMSLGAELAGSELLAGLSPEILGTIGGLSNAAIIGGGMGLTGLALSGGNLGQGLRYGLGGYGGASLATAGMNYMNQPTAPTPIETATATPGGAQAVNTQVAPAGGSTFQEGTRFEAGAPTGEGGITPKGGVSLSNAPGEFTAADQQALNDRIAAQTGNIPRAIGADLEQLPSNIPAYSALNAPLATAADQSYLSQALDFAKAHPYITAAGIAAPFLLKKPSAPTGTSNPQMIRPHTYTRNAQVPANMIGASYVPGQNTSERQWFNPYYTAQEPYRAADGGIIALAGGGMAAGGGPVELMSNQATTGANTMYPMANMRTSAFATPFQTPQSINMMANMAPSGGGTVDQMSGEPNMQGSRMAAGGSVPSYGFGGFLGDAVSNIGSAIGHIGKSDSGGDPEGWKRLLENMGGQQPPTNEKYGHQYMFDPQTGQFSKVMASGGITDLGGYSDGGRLLRGPGDGVSDSIPAQIGAHQPARLADGEFVVPARIVSELGNGSTDAGARQLYKMMDRVQQARGKTTGKNKVAHNTNAAKYLPA
jgi:hypothetical protein